MFCSERSSTIWIGIKKSGARYLLSVVSDDDTSKWNSATKIVQIVWVMGKHYRAKQNFTLTVDTLSKCVSCDLPRATQ